MNKEKREPDYPVELESQFIMRLPEEPAKALRDLITNGENFKNRLSISIENDMRHGEVRLDHWLLHAKIVDLPTIIESLKTIDRKSVYKTANICQLMLCKDEIDQTTDEEAPSKNKKKDPLKVDKKFLWPHGITPPTKNIRRRRFRKTLRKKCAEAPEIEKEVKRLLRADNEAISVTWEVIKEESDDSKNDVIVPEKTKPKKGHNSNVKSRSDLNNQSKVEDIFGGAVSDSDPEDDNIDIEDSRMSTGEGQMSDSNSINSSDFKGKQMVTQFKSEMFSRDLGGTSTPSMHKKTNIMASTSSHAKEVFQSFDNNASRSIKLQQLTTELEELKLRKHRTQLEISGLQNMTLKQRFQDILQTLNNEIVIKEVEIKNAKK